MKRRVLSLLMTLCLVFTLLPVSAQADEGYEVSTATELYRLLAELGDSPDWTVITARTEEFVIDRDITLPENILCIITYSLPYRNIYLGIFNHNQ